MRANVFRDVNEFGIEEVERPGAVIGEAVIRVTLTTICGTDLHIVRGQYPVQPGLVIEHEAVGVIEELGEGVEANKELIKITNLSSVWGLPRYLKKI